MTKAIDHQMSILESVWEISDMISSSSTLLKPEEKELRKESVLESRKSLETFRTEHPEYFNSTSIKGHIDIFLGFWNDFISLDSERFWAEIEARKVDIKRKKSLRNILLRGRILDVHEAMAVRSQWEELMASTYVAQQFTETERRKLQEIMEEDEMKRVNLFKKCLRNQNLPNSSALMYWDSMAYFNVYNLFEKHFSLAEIYQIIKIRKESDERMLKEISGKRYPGAQHNLPTT